MQFGRRRCVHLLADRVLGNEESFAGEGGLIQSVS